MPPTRIYDPVDASALGSRAQQMMADSEVLKANHVAPTLHQRATLLSAIVEFVRRKGRKIYGGHALNAAFIQKGLPPIYPNANDLVVNDIEFYSPDPIGDVREICNRFFVDRHRYVQGKEAMHSGTYTISVEFARICDVSFMPQRVFDAIPAFRMDSGDVPLLGVEPSLAIVDHLRILCDPFTSYWKLDKHLPRMLMVQEHFPIDLPVTFYPGTPGRASSRHHADKDGRMHPMQELIDCVSAWAASREAVVSVADHALAFFAKVLGADTISLDTPIRQMTLVSANYAQDLESLNELLTEKGCVATEHYPFVDLMGSRTIFRFAGSNGGGKDQKGAPIATLIDGRGKALPSVGRDPDDGVHVASFTYALMVSLAMRFLAQTENRETVAHVHGAIASNLIAIRKLATKDATPSVIDPHNPFREVNLNYLGTPRSDMSIHMEVADERRLRSPPGSMIWFTYDPNGGSRRQNDRHRRGKGSNSNSNSNEKEKENNGKGQPYFIARCDGHSIMTPKDSLLVRLRSEREIKAMLEKMAEANVDEIMAHP